MSFIIIRFSKLQKYLYSISFFVILSAVFIFGSKLIRDEIKSTSYERFQSKVNKESTLFIKNIEEKLFDLSNLLNGVRGFYSVNQKLSIEQWQQYIKNVKSDKNFSIISTIGLYFPNLDKQSNYFVNLKKEFTSTSTFDIDTLVKDPYYQMSIDLARDTNAIVVSPSKVFPPYEDQSAFIIYLPLYKETFSPLTLDQRRQNIIGYVIALVNSNNLFGEIINETSSTIIKDFEIVDSTYGQQTIFDNSIRDSNLYPYQLSPTTEIQKFRINFGTRIWEINLKLDNYIELSFIEKNAPYYFIVVGLIISFLFSLLIFYFSLLRSKAEDIARNSIKDLQKFKLAVENSSDHIVITDPNGIVLYANKAVEVITGFSTKEIIGKKVGSKTLWGGRMGDDVYQKFWRQILIEKKPFVGEFENRRKNGELYTAETNVSPVIDQSGQVIFFVGIERDVTKIKEVDRMKTEFITLASHQLRTPISAIKWFLEILLNDNAGKLSKEQREIVSGIEQSNNRMVDLVNILLDLSRIESGKLKISAKPTDLKWLMQQVIKDVEVKANQKNQSISFDLDDNLPIVWLDYKLIEQVIFNLLVNAITYTPNGGQIKVSVSRDNQEIIFNITDNGLGIPSNDQPKIFDRFYRASNAITQDTEGNGLGLYLVKTIVESSGGRVWFESREGKGSSFYFSLPITYNR